MTDKIDPRMVKWEDDPKYVPDSPPINPKMVAWEDKSKGKPLPANAGMASLLASVAGLPADTMERGINLTRALQGAIAGPLGLTDWMPPLLSGSVGGAEWNKQVLRNTGEPGLSPDDPSTSPLGKAQYDFVARGGVVPGGALPAIGSMVAEKALGPDWAGVGAMVPQAAITTTNAVTAPGRQRAERQNAMTDATRREGREAGYVLPPAEAGGGMVARGLESVGGKAAMGQQAAIANQRVTNDLARKELGLPKDSPISMQAIESQRHRWSSPYREVASISTQAAETLEKLKQARFESNAYFKHYDVSADPASLAKAKQSANDAKALEKALEGFAQNAGKPQLVQELRDARMMIAKSFDVERALNVATGDVSAPALGRMVDAKKPLSGGLGTAGRYQQAFPHFMREGEKVPAPDVSLLNPLTSVALGLGGYGAMGWPGIAMSALPFVRGPTRAGLLSGPAQNAMLPDYGPAVNPAPNPQLLYQLGIIEGTK